MSLVDIRPFRYISAGDSRTPCERVVDQSNLPVSVVIPMFNGACFIHEAIASVLNQTRQPQEIIVVDDCSTDDSVPRAKQIAADSPVPIRVIRLETNSGSPARPMNTGIQAANGEIICVLDQDDVWLPTKLQLQADVLRNDSEVSFVYSFFGILGDERKTREMRRAWTHRLTQAMWFDGKCYRCSGDAAFDLFVRWENYVAGFPGFMFRREDWLARQGFDESLSIAMDFDFLCWLTTRGSAVLVPETHFLRREHATNLTSREVPRLIDVIRILLRHVDPDEFRSRPDCRHALASKIVRMAQFFAFCGCESQARRMLDLSYTVCPRRVEMLIKPLRRAQLRGIRWIYNLLGFSNCRRVAVDEAATSVAQVEALLTDHGIRVSGQRRPKRSGAAKRRKVA